MVAPGRSAANRTLVGLLLPFCPFACNPSANPSPPEHPRAEEIRPVPAHDAPPRSPIDLGPPPSEGWIGSADSIGVPTEDLVSPDGTWLVACQAREGNVIDSYLFLGAGAGTAVQGGIVRRNGRFWAVAVDDELVVLDVSQPRAEGTPAWRGPRELDPVRVRARIPLQRIASANAFSFDDDAEIFVFIASAPRSVVVLDLRDGSERTIDHGSGHPIRATASDGTLSVLLQRSRPSASQWRAPALCYSPGECGGVVHGKPAPTRVRRFDLGPDSRGPARRMAAEPEPADRHLTRVRAGVLLRDTTRGIALRRLRDGSIVWERGEQREALVPADRTGAVHRVVEVGGKVLICSGSDPDDRALRLFGPGEDEVDIGLTCRKHANEDLLRVGRSALDLGGAIVNVTTGQVELLSRPHRVLFDHNNRTYLSADSTPQLPPRVASIDWSSGEYSVVAHGEGEFAMTADHWGYLRGAGQIVDLDTAAVVGDVRDGIEPFAISESGHLLMPKASLGPGWMMKDGPLRWEAPLFPVAPAGGDCGRLHVRKHAGCPYPI